MTKRKKAKRMDIKSKDHSRRLSGELGSDETVPEGKVRVKLEGGFAGEGECLCDTCIKDPAYCENEFNRVDNCEQCGEQVERTAEDARAGRFECPTCGAKWTETPVFCHWYDEDASQITDGITSRRGEMEWDVDKVKTTSARGHRVPDNLDIREEDEEDDKENE